jgi:16S rRNA (uracil1498-N3)-methyltransferase
MNSLAIFEDEGWSQGSILLTGERAQSVYFSGVHDVGSEIRVFLFGGDKGTAKVIRFGTDVIELELISSEPSLKLRPIDLIVGLSRPQTTKKVIQAAVMAGVRSLHLVHLESGQPSYLDSHLLRPEDLRQEIVKSLEQICEGLYPEIRVHRAFHRFIDEQQHLLSESPGKLRVVAHSGGRYSLAGLVSDGAPEVVIAVGSEGGWSDKELKRLDILGFDRVGLGPRVVRVEVALLYLLGQTINITAT